MRASSTRCLAACFVLFITMNVAQSAFAADILIGDAKSQPESLTLAPGGVLIVGSASSPFVYKARSGFLHCRKVYRRQLRRPGDLLPRYVGGRRQQYVVDMSINAGAQHHSSTAAYRAEKL